MELLGQIGERVNELLDQQQELVEIAKRATEEVPEAVLAALSKLEQQFRSLQEYELPRERKIAISEMSDIPGVIEAVHYQRWATQRNKEGADDPVPSCWQDVPLRVDDLPEHPVIRDVIENFQFREQIIEIVP